MRLATASSAARLLIASSWGPTYEDLTSTLAQRADLEYLGRSEGQEVWRRKRNDSTAA